MTWTEHGIFIHQLPIIVQWLDLSLHIHLWFSVAQRSSRGCGGGVTVESNVSIVHRLALDTVQCWCQVTSILGPALHHLSHHNLTQQLDFPGARRGAARSYNYKETYYPESWQRGDPVQWWPAAAWPLTAATFLSWRHLCSALDLVPLPVVL